MVAVSCVIRPLVHYSLHLVVPCALAWLFFRPERRMRACVIMLLTMLVDADHLLSRPIFDPNRPSVGTHLLHSYPMVVLYVLMCVLPYERWGWPWWLRAVGIGLTLHMVTDWQDYNLWAACLGA